jgi:transcriptional regulator GlxA family with amidase domain
LLAGADRHAFRATAGIKSLLPELVTELENPGALHEPKVAGLARAVVVELVRSIQAGQRVIAPGVLGGTHHRIRAFIERVAQHPEQPWTLAKMATHCRLGRTQFARIFHEQTGDTPMRFINRMRVRLACRLLRGTRLPVTRIALDCGFGSSQYFAKVFNAYTGGMDACGYRRNRCPA